MRVPRHLDGILHVGLGREDTLALNPAGSFISVTAWLAVSGGAPVPPGTVLVLRISGNCAAPSATTVQEKSANRRMRLIGIIGMLAREVRAHHSISGLAALACNGVATVTLESPDRGITARRTSIADEARSEPRCHEMAPDRRPRPDPAASRPGDPH